MKRRILSTALALALCLTMLPSTARAVNEPQFKWFDVGDVWGLSENSKEGLIAVYTEDGPALFNLEGETLVDFGTYDVIGVKYTVDDGYISYDEYPIGNTNVGLLSVQKDEKFGLISTTGEEVVPCELEYDNIYSFSEGLALVEKNRKFGYIDTTGEEVVPCEYDSVGDFSEGLAWVKKGGEYGYINTSGEIVVPIGEYVSVSSFSEGLAAVSYRWNRGKWGYIDTTDWVVIPFEYDYAYDFSEGLARVRKGGKDGFIDRTGEVVIPFEYDYAYDFSEGLARVEKDGKYGFIDRTGEVVVDCIYDNAGDFSGGLARVATGEYGYDEYGYDTFVGKWGFIDATGEVVIPIKYEDATDFSDEGAEYYDFSLAVVVQKDADGNLKLGYINTGGELVIPCEYHMGSGNGGLRCVGKYEDSDSELIDGESAKYGLYNKDGEMLLPLIYDKLNYCFNTGISDHIIIAVEKDGRLGIASEPLSDYLTIPEDGDYTVSFDSKGGSEVKTQYVDEDGKVTKPADPTKVKHAFDGWYGAYGVAEEDVFNDVYKWDFDTAVIGDITLYAKWTAKDYTVTFNSEDGSSVAAQYVDGGEKLTKPANPTKSGNTFGGWYRDKVFVKTEDNVYTFNVDTENLFNDVYKWDFDTDVVMGDFTLHAKWTANSNNQNNNNNNDNGGGGGNNTTITPKPEEPKEEPKDETPSITFTDVPADAYYADAVAWAIEKGITNGTGDGTFSPNAACTRGQMVTFLWRVAGCPTVSGGTSFSDVTTDSYYADAVAWAVSMGITNGTGDGLFSPDAECSRAQMAVFLFRMVGGSAAGESGFGDVDANAYYADAVAWAVANGITNGTGDGVFSPNMTCSRAQMVTFLFRCFAE